MRKIIIVDHIGHAFDAPCDVSVRPRVSKDGIEIQFKFLDYASVFLIISPDKADELSSTMQKAAARYRHIIAKKGGAK